MENKERAEEIVRNINDVNIKKIGESYLSYGIYCFTLEDLKGTWEIRKKDEKKWKDLRESGMYKIVERINSINNLLNDKLHQQAVLRLEIIELENEKELLSKEHIKLMWKLNEN